MQVPPDASASVGNHAAILGINTALGGLSAGVLRVLNGGSFVDGFVGGAMGGALAYGGKRLAAQRFDGAGLLGRQVAAVGNSIVYNAAGNAPFVERLMIPLGPLPARLHIATGPRPAVRATVDLVSAGAVIYGILAPGVRLDLGASISSGAAVFVERRSARPPATVLVPSGGSTRAATTVGGAIFLDGYAEGDPVVLAHERVHVLQFDFVLAAWGDRLDALVLGRAPAVDRWVKLNALAGVMGVANQTLFLLDERDGLPWEREARLLAGR